jgi:hypothetical protein
MSSYHDDPAADRTYRVARATGKEALTPGWVNIRRTLPMPLCRVRFSTPTGGSSTYTYTYSRTRHAGISDNAYRNANLAILFLLLDVGKY